MKSIELDVVATRGEEIESRHRVHAAVVGPDDVLVAAANDASTVSSWRSCAKPFQVMQLQRGPLVLGLVFIAVVYLIPRGVAGIRGRLPVPRRTDRRTA